MIKRSFEEKIYSLMPLTKLTILAISEIINNGEECAYERVVKECFDLFPKRFGFRRYPEWPDGSRIKIEVLRCRDNGWITGNEKNGYQITSLGRRVVQEILNELQGDNVKKPGRKPPRERGETIINYLNQSEPYKRFKQNKGVFNISEEEFRRLLVATFETPHRVLRQNLKYCLDICEQYGEHNLIEFLKECERKKASLLKSHNKNIKYRRKKSEQKRI